MPEFWIIDKGRVIFIETKKKLKEEKKKKEPRVKEKIVRALIKMQQN